jgi:hypothetical protein
MESAHRAADLVDRGLRGESVDWDEQYDVPVRRAVAVFRAFVESWYTKELEDIFFADGQFDRVRQRITSVLGGNVLRTDNPLIREPVTALRDLHAMAMGASKDGGVTGPAEERPRDRPDGG